MLFTGEFITFDNKIKQIGITRELKDADFFNRIKFLHHVLKKSDLIALNELKLSEAIKYENENEKLIFAIIKLTLEKNLNFKEKVLEYLGIDDSKLVNEISKVTGKDLNNLANIKKTEPRKNYNPITDADAETFFDNLVVEQQTNEEQIIRTDNKYDNEITNFITKEIK